MKYLKFFYLKNFQYSVVSKYEAIDFFRTASDHTRNTYKNVDFIETQTVN